MTTFNYSTHEESKRKAIADYLTREQVKFEEDKTTSLTGTITFHFQITMEFTGSAEDFGRVREIQTGIKNLL